jgi:two-component system phosphate regulon response regulator PhoB
METKKILVASDESGVVQIISAKLRNNGCEVVTANNGDEAFILCCQQKPEFVIADYQLPNISGIELAQNIREKSGLVDISFILLTTKETELDEKQMGKAGITCCMNKPFSPKEILNRIENILASAPAK